MNSIEGNKESTSQNSNKNENNNLSENNSVIKRSSSLITKPKDSFDFGDEESSDEGTKGKLKVSISPLSRSPASIKKYLNWEMIYNINW